MNILVGGDLVPSGMAEELFKSGDIEGILGNGLEKIWLGANYRFFNLECPITDSDDKIIKCGPNIKCDPLDIAGIKELEPTCIMLANNHIMDYSENGLLDTVKVLDENGIDWIGVGENLKKIRKTFSFVCDGKKISIYNCCEHEFSVASEETSGANPYDEDDIGFDIRDAKRNSDYVIVIYHGGKEYYRYPSPKLQKRCHRMVKEGADLVICQHSHCIGCEEVFMDGTIVYGQGNFIFNREYNEFWGTSLLINLDVSNHFKISYLPIVQTKNGTRLASEKESYTIMEGYNLRSEEIKKENFLQNKYRKYADEQLDHYFAMINRSGFLLRAIRKFMPFLHPRIKLRYENILNVVNCEAHNELFAEGLKNKLKRL